MVPTNDPAKENRLIVLIPDSLAGNQELAYKLYWMAVRDRCEILFLTLVDDPENQLSIMGTMSIMKAVTSGNNLVVHSILVETARWLKALREIYRPGDRIVCQEEQRVRNGFLKTVPIHEFLQSMFHAPTITVSGFYHPDQIQMHRLFHSLVTWLGFVLILGMFTVIEIRLNPALLGLPGKVLLGILFTIEIGAIWGWDSIAG